MDNTCPNLELESEKVILSVPREEDQIHSLEKTGTVALGTSIRE